MNLRILKKLSKRAAPYLPLLGDKREQFLSERGDNYHGLVITARKHWERCPSVHRDTFTDDEIVIAPRCRAGTTFPYVKVRMPSHPWPRTAMVGGTSGYYEPEWDEECAWAALRCMVAAHFTDWDAVARDDATVPWSTRPLRTPSQVFAAADEMIAELKPDEEG